MWRVENMEDLSKYVTDKYDPVMAKKMMKAMYGNLMEDIENIVKEWKAGKLTSEQAHQKIHKNCYEEDED